MIDLGHEPPLSVDGTEAAVIDRRRVSVQWFSGTILTGLCGAALIGGAVFASLDGETTFARMPERVESALRGALGGNDKTATLHKSDRLPPPSEAEDMLADYRSLGLTLGRHPLALLRPPLAARRFATAAELRGFAPGRLARAAGLVTHRQRPETAKGTVFVTLEDETGTVNVIVWPGAADAQRLPLLRARLLGVHGRWQREGEVAHLVAGRLVDLSPLLQGLAARSRDFR